MLCEAIRSICGNQLARKDRVMSTGEILLTFACVCVGTSLIIALLFHFWPRYGSVEAAIVHTDHILDEMETVSTEH